MNTKAKLRAEKCDEFEGFRADKAKTGPQAGSHAQHELYWVVLGQACRRGRVSLSRKPSKNSVCVCVCVCVCVLRGAGSLLRRGREHGNPKGEGTPCGQIYGDVMSQQRVGIVGQRAAKGSSNLGSFRAVVVCFIYG